MRRVALFIASIVVVLLAIIAFAACDGGSPASPSGNRVDAGDASNGACVIGESTIGDCKLGD